jgi:hypothetical protein
MRWTMPYGLLYRRGLTPWDTGVTPPEVVELVEGKTAMPAGRALDLGCGTEQFELSIGPRGPVAAADAAILTRQIVRSVARDSCERSATTATQTSSGRSVARCRHGWRGCCRSTMRAAPKSPGRRHPGLRLLHRGDRVPAHPLRLVLHRGRVAVHPHRRSDPQPGCGMGDPAGAQPLDGR